METRTGKKWLLLCGVIWAGVACAGTAAASRGDETAGEASDEGSLDAEYARLMALARERRAPVKRAQGSVDIEALPVLGVRNAPVTVIEFGTLQCGYCRRHAFTTLPSLLERVDGGELNYVYHDYPVAEDQRPLVAATLCAAEQDKYFEFRQELLTSTGKPDTELLRQSAVQAGLEPDELVNCIDSGRKNETVHGLIKAGRELGIRGTPTFLIGSTDESAGRVLVERRIDGAQPYRVFAKEIDALLSAR